MPKFEPQLKITDSTGAVLANRKREIGSFAGPASYPTGGFVLDLSARFSSIDSINFDLIAQVAGQAAVLLRYDVNTPTPGKITIQAYLPRTVVPTSIGNVSGQPGGVTVQAASGPATSAEAAHTHTLGGHTHGGVTSTTAPATKQLAGAGGAAWDVAHNHAVSADNSASGAGSGHSHTYDNIFQHAHALATTPTNLNTDEVPNATSIANRSWRYEATGTP